jgi:hypothetical protein
LSRVLRRYEDTVTQEEYDRIDGMDDPLVSEFVRRRMYQSSVREFGRLGRGFDGPIR